MPSLKQTTVVLNEVVQEIKSELAPIYGLKNILSAGLLLFNRLSDGDQKKVVAEVNGLVVVGQQSGEDEAAAARDAAKQKRTRRSRKAAKG